jgi:hypothetical protein
LNCPVYCIDADVAVEGQTQVDLGAQAGCATLTVACAWVTLNGSRLSEGGDYAIVGDRIVFVSPLRAGDQVTVRWLG